MDRPDWKDAPEWARYLGRDNNGMFCWFENEPVCKKGEFFPQGGQYDMPTTIEPLLFSRPVTLGAAPAALIPIDYAAGRAVFRWPGCEVE